MPGSADAMVNKKVCPVPLWGVPKLWKTSVPLKDYTITALFSSEYLLGINIDIVSWEKHLEKYLNQKS